ncbi:hypothetical protein A3G67_03510 [Candidatus Roizmanbacteria bacterium RIFCSPLOWO2_12_FULL_40_12]|uniref:Cell shape-determining protein MreB n=1 Tax=Candidatus Roizmanbacteria bacterium RIFCSPLOWO2_01_FULL_40_42 TaxID=1802066 RepID=A0A1F7J5K1_9BACT|nr:MAG: hypothetical protein A2779_03145 [Candidatus Roizmanbacteria bacterium RIFCSPHIGHO2_01_FULL_40_98]OGK28335.1 MAG: hypothetical protein A3C31_00510 [Candidatus Roizmanbacteria bacterium RIFCSPHIGHO2_02_FULL_40_53]OGK30571.1 MAG: hypothetical protein A2W49_03195 [Candidatus Roizmanbacteria bacterium RIFCSPHIGHO2_12_41_18]OGK36985.1 MAG: hypothetical protein A3E69_00770 [Candidatus Roizmanbacteria bacterium RIFCSPHIGHO2_12_FULL_40_130]OGK50891.1 MAG: hypothetical protein A3B50_01280 [Candi
MLNFIQNLSKIQFPFISSLSLYVDLGTTNTRIAIKDKGVVLQEPTFLGYNKRSREFIFFGNEAKRIVGKVPEFIQIIRPMVNGIISEFDAEVALVRKFIERGVSPYVASYPLLKPGFEVVVAVPSIATEIEQKAVEEVFYKLGVSRVHLVEKAIATAIGCGFNIFLHKPVLVVDLGGGIIDIAVLSGGGVVMQKTLRSAGEHMNKLIYNYIHLKHGMILGETTCEDLKINLFRFDSEEKTSIVRGKSLETGLPKSVKIRSSDIKEALLSAINQITDAIKEIIELSPPEVIDEIYNNGFVLAGGLANVQGIENFFAEELKLKSTVVTNKEHATLSGLVRIGRRKDTLQRLKIELP